MKSGSNLEMILEGGQFAVTAECDPPRGADAEVIKKKGEILRGAVDAVNVTDNRTGVVRMSSVAACVILREIGLEPVLQMVCRDRNRIAIQSDVLGASALGIRNVLCLSGCHQKFGDHPQAKGVFDMDSIHLIQTMRTLRDEGRFLSGQQVRGVPRMFIGATANPFADPFEFRVIRLAKKVAAGADFIQTQCVFDIEKFGKYMSMVRDKKIHERVHILAGVTPLKSLDMANYMKRFVPGVDVPDAIIERIKGVPKEKQAQEGIDICVETIQRLKDIEGIHGVHIMAIEWESEVPAIVEAAGLLPRPSTNV